MIRILACALAALALAGHAAAREVEAGWAVGVASDHVKRGVLRSGEGPDPFGSVDLFFGDAYAGAFATRADLGGADAEVNLYVGWRPEAYGWLWDFSVARNQFPGAPTGADLDHWDVQAQVSRAVGPASGALTVGWSPDYLGGSGDARWAEARAAWRFTPRFEASATVGREESDLSNHDWWSVGGTAALSDAISLDLRWWDGGRAAYGRPADGRLVAALRARF